MRSVLIFQPTIFEVIGLPQSGFFNLKLQLQSILKDKLFNHELLKSLGDEKLMVELWGCTLGVKSPKMKYRVTL